MGVYIGLDFHARSQTVCWCDTANGEMQQRTLDHERDNVRTFYAQFSAPAVVGLESSGYALWFHQLVEELVDLLLRGDFPAVHVPSPASRDVLSLLRYGHRLVRMRTMLRNGLQAVALSHQVRLRARLFSVAGRERLQALPLTGAHALQRQQSLLLLDALQEQIDAVERELMARAQGDVRVERLRTQPGVGLLTALAVLHTLEPVSRFRRARQVAAYCGLDPQEQSSGERQRYGHITKQGNRGNRARIDV